MKVLFGILLFFSSFSGFAQNKYYLYIDSEQKLNFYLHHKDTIVTSKGGYLIIPSLNPGEYDFRLGIPGENEKQYIFSVSLMERDRSFTLREKSGNHSLYDLFSGEIIEPKRTIGGTKSEFSGQVRSDAYSLLLAGVVNDSAVLYKVVDMAAIKRQEEVAAKAEAEKESLDSMINAANLSETEDINDSLAMLSANPESQQQPGQLDSKPGDSLSSMEKDSLAFLANSDKSNENLSQAPELSDSLQLADTDSAAIAKNILSSENGLKENAQPALDSLSSAVADSSSFAGKRPVKEEDEELVLELSEADGDSILLSGEKLAEDALKEQMPIAVKPVIIKDTLENGQRNLVYAIREDTVSLYIQTDTLATQIVHSEPEEIKSDQEEKKPLQPEPAVISKSEPAKPGGLLINSNCTRFATDSEIDKLRVRMLKLQEDHEKLKLAEKLFRQKCFTVKQTIALSELFSDDDGRYNFFEAIYPFLSDSGNFILLSQYLQSEFYKNRLKSLIPSRP